MTCMHAFHAHQTGSSILFSSVKKKKILHIFTSYALWDKSHGYGGCRPWQWHLLIFCRGHGTRRYSRTEALMAVARASSSACKAKKKTRRRNTRMAVPGCSPTPRRSANHSPSPLPLPFNSMLPHDIGGSPGPRTTPLHSSAIIHQHYFSDGQKVPLAVRSR